MHSSKNGSNVYSQSEVNQHIYETTQIGRQRGLDIDYKPLNSIQQGTSRIQYLQSIVSVSNAMKTEVDAYTTLEPICSKLEVARNENAMRRAEIRRQFHADTKHVESLLTSRLTPIGCHLLEIRQSFLKEAVGLVNSWNPKRAARLCTEKYIPKIIRECDAGLFKAIASVDGPSLVWAWHKAIDQLCILNPEISCSKFEPQWSPIIVPLNNITNQMTIKFNIGRGGVIFRSVRLAGGIFLLGTGIGVLTGVPIQVAAPIAGILGTVTGVSNAYVELSKKMSSEYTRIIEQTVLPLFRSYTLDLFKSHRASLLNTIDMLSQPQYLFSNTTYKAVRGNHEVEKAVSHKASVLNYVMHREYAAYINTLIEKGNGTPIQMTDDLNTYLHKVESEIGGNPREVEIRKIIGDARKWLALQAEERTQHLKVLQVKIEAAKIELEDLLKTVPVEPEEPQTTENTGNEPQDDAQAETSDAKDQAQAETSDAKAAKDKPFLQKVRNGLRLWWLLYA